MAVSFAFSRTYRYRYLSEKETVGYCKQYSLPNFGNSKRSIDRQTIQYSDARKHGKQSDLILCALLVVKNLPRV